jgi:nucleoside 2-deoxyribosyltransferase
MKRIYIAGPYTQGDVAHNIRNAYEAANALADAGFAPFVPHHTHFWHMMFPRPYAEWLRLDLAFLSCCDAVLRLPGLSQGADGEVAAAKSLGIPVFTDIRQLIATLSSTELPTGKK